MLTNLFLTTTNNKLYNKKCNNVTKSCTTDVVNVKVYLVENIPGISGLFLVNMVGRFNKIRR
jgi:hypothetical protein